MKLDIKENMYFFGKSTMRDNSYEIYLSKDLSFPAMGRIMCSLEGVFITKNNLEGFLGSRKNYSLHKDGLENFEKMYNGKFYFNGE